jgi:hypothetical protein
MSEARVDRLEAEIGDRLRRVEEAVTRIEATLTATQPHLATKAELADLRADMATGFGDLRAALADKPGKVFLATAIGILLAAYAAGLAGLAALPVVAKLVE